MNNVIAIRTKPIFGRKHRRPARTWVLPMLLAIPLLAAALYFGNEAPVTPALAGAPVMTCHGAAPASCRP